MFRKVDKREACAYIEQWIAFKTLRELGNDLGISGERVRQYAKELGIKKPSRRTAALRAEIDVLKHRIADLELRQGITVA